MQSKTKTMYRYTLFYFAAGDPVVTPRDATVIELPKDQPNKLPPLQK